MNNEIEKMLTDAIINLGLGIENLQKEMKGMRLAQEETNHRLDKLGKQQAKTNLAIGELRLSYMKMDDSFNKYALRNDERAQNHEIRIVRLEEKTSGHSYLAGEPTVRYKRKKRK